MTLNFTTGTGEGKPPPIKHLWVHRCCAYPIAICWIIGAFVLCLVLTAKLSEFHVFEISLSNWSTLLQIIVCYSAIIGLGFFVGVWGFGWIISPFCERMNGAPHEIGEKVLILSGRFKGTTSEIYQITAGQGGWPVLHVNLGAENREKYQDLFESCDLCRLSPRKPEKEDPHTHRDP